LCVSNLVKRGHQLSKYISLEFSTHPGMDYFICKLCILHHHF